MVKQKGVAPIKKPFNDDANRLIAESLINKYGNLWTRACTSNGCDYSNTRTSLPPSSKRRWACNTVPGTVGFSKRTFRCSCCKKYSVNVQDVIKVLGPIAQQAASNKAASLAPGSSAYHAQFMIPQTQPSPIAMSSPSQILSPYQPPQAAQMSQSYHPSQVVLNTQGSQLSNMSQYSPIFVSSHQPQSSQALSSLVAPSPGHYISSQFSSPLALSLQNQFQSLDNGEELSDDDDDEALSDDDDQPLSNGDDHPSYLPDDFTLEDDDNMHDEQEDVPVDNLSDINTLSSYHYSQSQSQLLPQSPHNPLMFTPAQRQAVSSPVTSPKNVTIVSPPSRALSSPGLASRNPRKRQIIQVQSPPTQYATASPSESRLSSDYHQTHVQLLNRTSEFNTLLAQFNEQQAVLSKCKSTIATLEAENASLKALMESTNSRFENQDKAIMALQESIAALAKGGKPAPT
ncbi:hypothetical protein BGZ76_005637, partial [Entomortierella beljakovae]